MAAAAAWPAACQQLGFPWPATDPSERCKGFPGELSQSMQDGVHWACHTSACELVSTFCVTRFSGSSSQRTTWYTGKATSLPADWLFLCCSRLLVLQVSTAWGTPAGRSLSADRSLPCCRTCLGSPVGAARVTLAALAAPAARCLPPPVGLLARPQGPAPTLTSRERRQVGACHILNTEASPSVLHQC